MLIIASCSFLPVYAFNTWACHYHTHYTWWYHMCSVNDTNWVCDACTYRGRDAIPSLENKLNDLILLSLFLLESARGVTRMWMRTLRRVYVCLCARMLGQEVIKVFTSSSMQLTRHGNEAVSKLCVAWNWLLMYNYISSWILLFLCLQTTSRWWWPSRGNILMGLINVGQTKPQTVKPLVNKALKQ